MAPVTATTAKEVLHALEETRAARGVTKAELARRSRLRAQTVRRLLTDKAPNPTLTNVLDLLRPLGLGLRLVELPPGFAESDAEKVHAWLSFYGAPLYGATGVDPKSVPSLESALAEALKLSREDATLARAIPVALQKNRGRLALELLRDEAGRWNERRTLGFFLDLTAELGHDEAFKEEAARLRAEVPLRTTQFFRPTTKRERDLSELKTPEVARRWGFRMNMGMDSFASMFEKGMR
jgi:transcriptional regulator with XRE-family HTH domain